MSDTEIWQRTQRIFRETLDHADLELTAETTAADVEGWDSITNIALMVALEGEFAIRFNTGEMAGLKDVGQLIERIRARLPG